MARLWGKKSCGSLPKSSRPLTVGVPIVGQRADLLEQFVLGQNRLAWIALLAPLQVVRRSHLRRGRRAWPRAPAAVRIRRPAGSQTSRSISCAIGWADSRRPCAPGHGHRSKCGVPRRASTRSSTTVPPGTCFCCHCVCTGGRQKPLRRLQRIGRHLRRQDRRPAARRHPCPAPAYRPRCWQMQPASRRSLPASAVRHKRQLLAWALGKIAWHINHAVRMRRPALLVRILLFGRFRHQSSSFASNHCERVVLSRQSIIASSTSVRSSSRSSSSAIALSIRQ